MAYRLAVHDDVFQAIGKQHLHANIQMADSARWPFICRLKARVANIRHERQFHRFNFGLRTARQKHIPTDEQMTVSATVTDMIAPFLLVVTDHSRTCSGEPLFRRTRS